jgi:hypothetical protein
MHRKLSLISGTLLSLTLFLLFHALLAITATGYFIFLLPWIIFRRSMDERKISPLDGAGLGPHGI